MTSLLLRENDDCTDAWIRSKGRKGGRTDGNSYHGGIRSVFPEIPNVYSINSFIYSCFCKLKKKTKNKLFSGRNNLPFYFLNYTPEIRFLFLLLLV